MNRELLSVIEQIERDKGIPSDRIVKAVESALLSAAKKKYGSAENVQVKLDPATGEIEMVSLKKIVDEVTNPKAEISLEEAKKVDENAESGDEIGFLLDMEDFGRIAAQTAKQVIFQKVREAEWDAVQKEYGGRVGEMVTGTILGQERRNYIVEIGKTEALLPAQEQIPRENFHRGDRVRAILLEVKSSSKGPQVILSRSSPEFVKKLFEMEVPEISEGVVEVKGVVREAGDRTKIAVSSNEPTVDPVGACVGVKGSRVQSVVRELRGEKIDIITWTDDPRTFIGEALSPAIVEKVGINEKERSAVVVVADAQLSLAIGKRGQNVRLASRLTDWKVDIINESEYEKERSKEREKEVSLAFAQEKKAQELKEQQSISQNIQPRIADLPGVGEKLEESLKEYGFDTLEKIAEATESQLSSIPLIGEKTAKKLIESAIDLLKTKQE
jgi:N utilization substance protein A